MLSVRIVHLHVRSRAGGEFTWPPRAVYSARLPNTVFRMTRRTSSKRPLGTRTGPTQGRFRIIGGTHRGRRLSFPAVPGLRPSPARVRETVFNWLAPQLPGARCLDLYAGSGALGLEAASRGAGQVVFVERDARACEAIAQHINTLQVEQGVVFAGTVANFFERRPGAAPPFDVVFADPPYRDHALAQLCTLLAKSGWLKPSAAVYLEHAATDPAPDLQPDWPAGWTLSRSRKAGQVAYHLAQTGDA